MSFLNYGWSQVTAQIPNLFDEGRTILKFTELKIPDVDRAYGWSSFQGSLFAGSNDQDFVYVPVYRWFFPGWLMISRGLLVVLNPHAYTFRFRGEEHESLLEDPAKRPLSFRGSDWAVYPSMQGLIGETGIPCLLPELGQIIPMKVHWRREWTSRGKQQRSE